VNIDILLLLLRHLVLSIDNLAGAFKTVQLTQMLRIKRKLEAGVLVS
jgi:hypothetical protein